MKREPGCIKAWTTLLNQNPPFKKLVAKKLFAVYTIAMFNLTDYRFDGSRRFVLSKTSTAAPRQALEAQIPSIFPPNLTTPNLANGQNEGSFTAAQGGGSLASAQSGAKLGAGQGAGGSPSEAGALIGDKGSSLKRRFVALTAENLQKVAELQAKLFSDNKESLLICLQALDAAGKDSLIRHTLCALNPIGLSIFTYRTPSVTEAQHDFLYRYHCNLPARGCITVFNRSYYEEVLVVAVHEDYKNYRLPDRATHDANGNWDYIEKKYRDIKRWEDYLFENGTQVVKIFLNVSKKTQAQRFLDRIDRGDKNYKFSPNDIKERPFFEKYQSAFEAAINGTASVNCPWYVLPADDKWFTRFLFSQVLLETLTKMDPHYMEITAAQREQFAQCKKELVAQLPPDEK